MIIKWLTVFFLGMFEVWIAIPAGLAMKIEETALILLTIAGGITGVGIVVFSSKHLREYILKAHAQFESNKKDGWDRRIWNKYGIVGLGLISPLLTGAPIGAALAIALGGKPIKVFTWFSIGVILWSIIFLHFTKAGLNTLGF